MARISLGHPRPRPCPGEKTVRRCTYKEEADDVILIDIDSENFENVIIIDTPESLPPKKNEGSSMLREDKCPFRNVINLDDDEIHDSRDFVGADNARFSAGTSKSRDSVRVAQNCKDSADAAVEDYQFVQDKGTPFRLSKCKRTYSGNYFRSNRYGLYSDSECDLSDDDDLSDCEIVEDISGKVQEQWEKASSRRRKNINNVGTSHFINKGYNQNAKSKDETRQHKEASSFSSDKSIDEIDAQAFYRKKMDTDFGCTRLSDDQQNDGASGPFYSHAKFPPSVHVEQADFLDCEPGKSWSHIDERRKNPSTSNFASRKESTKKSDHPIPIVEDKEPPEVGPSPPKPVEEDFCHQNAKSKDGTWQHKEASSFSPDGSINEVDEIDAEDFYREKVDEIDAEDFFREKVEDKSIEEIDEIDVQDFYRKKVDSDFGCTLLFDDTIHDQQNDGASGPSNFHAKQTDFLSCEPGNSSSHIDERRKNPYTSNFASRKESMKKFDHPIPIFVDNEPPEVRPSSAKPVPKDSCIGNSRPTKSEATKCKSKSSFECEINQRRSFPKDNHGNVQETATRSVEERNHFGSNHVTEAKLQEGDSVSNIHQQEDKDDLPTQNGDTQETCIISEREKLKETDEYKRADEEEWASRQQALQIQSEEARRLRQLRKRKRAESIRLLDMKRRQKERIEEVRNIQKKDEENMNLKETIRGEVRNELKILETKCKNNMASLLHLLGIQVGSWPKSSPQEIQAAYKRAMFTFHPDRAPQSDIRKQVEAEEKFKLVNRIKEKLCLQGKWVST